jgi:hypothetical protein
VVVVDAARTNTVGGACGRAPAQLRPPLPASHCHTVTLCVAAVGHPPGSP